LQQGAPAHQADAESADSHAVGDALDCLVQVVASGHEGCTVALQSGGILAAAQALQVSHLLLLPAACLQPSWLAEDVKSSLSLLSS